MKTNNQIILKKKKGQWWNIAANKPFSGFASINGQTFLYTKDGRKIPQSKPAPNIHNFIKNLYKISNRSVGQQLSKAFKSCCNRECQ